jgi:sulfatase modifying factor 1
MVELAGGTFLMGTDYPGGYFEDAEGPVREVSVLPFSIDAAPVTNAEFAKFTVETGYLTEAEQFGWSFVFWSHVPPDRFDELVSDTAAETPWWCKVEGAYWNAPEGPDSDVADRSDHPVVHVSWNDAAAYCNWYGKRLPSEAEWEYAARGGLQQKLFPWGDELTPGGQHMCNVWQGDFPNKDTSEDGFTGTCPIDAFPPNSFGLFSVAGNTWEWCSSSWSTGGNRACCAPSNTGESERKVIKGGSFLCHASYCNRYRVAARTFNTADSSASNIGFRCVSSSYRP